MRETIEWQGQAPLTLMLAPKTVLHLSAGKCRHIVCRTGLVWLSEAVAGADHVLTAGQAVQVASDVVLSGLPQAVISISTCRPAAAVNRQGPLPSQTPPPAIPLESTS